MHFEIEVNDYDVVLLLNRLISITGREPWKRKFATLQQQLNENAFLRDYQIERHGLELADLLWESFTAYKTGRVEFEKMRPSISCNKHKSS